MNTEAIEVICQKLGTTAEKIIPEAIKYGTKNETGLLIVGIVIFVFGLICGGIMTYFYFRDGDDVYDHPMLFTFCCCGVFIGLIIVGVQIKDVILWHTFPEISAYKMIFGWLQ